MDSEKDLLKQDLSKQEKSEEIEKFIEDAELMGGHEDIVELAKQKLQELLKKANNIEKTSEIQTVQVESMGGTVEEVADRTKEVDQKIEALKTEAQKNISEVQNENKSEAEIARENLFNILGDNVFNSSIDYSKGIEQIKYPDEPEKTFFNISLKQEDIKKVKNFLEIHKINDYRWRSRDQMQIWVRDGIQSPFK